MREFKINKSFNVCYLKDIVKLKKDGWGIRTIYMVHCGLKYDYETNIRSIEKHLDFLGVSYEVSESGRVSFNINISADSNYFLQKLEEEAKSDLGAKTVVFSGDVRLTSPKGEDFVATIWTDWGRYSPPEPAERDDQTSGRIGSYSGDVAATGTYWGFGLYNKPGLRQIGKTLLEAIQKYCYSLIYETL